MITFIIAFTAFILSFFIAKSLIGTVASILPGIIIFAITYILLSKIIAKKIENENKKSLIKIKNKHYLEGINLLLQAKKKYKYWQFFSSSSINAQVGSIYYMLQDFKKSKPFLKKTFFKFWTAKVMLAVIEFKKKKYKNMDKIFEKTSKHCKKEGLFWCTWAFCHYKIKNNQKAINILINGKKKIKESDKILNNNIKNLQNKRKMKMKGYGEQWLQFQLEISRIMKQAKSRNVRFRY
jgi:hypothetical protein